MYLKIAFAVVVLAASLSSAQACSPWDPRGCYEHHAHLSHHNRDVHHKAHHVHHSHQA
jgi:hypothetical protein